MSTTTTPSHNGGRETHIHARNCDDQSGSRRDTSCFYALGTPNNHTLSYITQPNNNCIVWPYCWLIYRHGYANNAWESERDQLVLFYLFLSTFTQRDGPCTFSFTRVLWNRGQNRCDVVWPSSLIELTNFFLNSFTWTQPGESRIQPNDFTKLMTRRSNLTYFFPHTLLLCSFRSVQQERQDPLPRS